MSYSQTVFLSSGLVQSISAYAPFSLTIDPGSIPVSNKVYKISYDFGDGSTYDQVVTTDANSSPLKFPQTHQYYLTGSSINNIEINANVYTFNTSNYTTYTINLQLQTTNLEPYTRLYYPEDGLVSYWNLDDDGQGSVSLMDSSSSNNNLSLNGSVYLTKGISNGGALFDNSGYLSDSTVFDFSSDFSISFWINPNSINSSRDLIISTNTNGYRGIDIYLDCCENGGQILGFDSPSVVGPFLGTTKIELNSWTHVAITRSGSNFKVYINGKFDQQFSDSTDYSCSFTLGKSNGWTYQYFSGILDEVGIWNIGLPEEEILKIYNCNNSYFKEVHLVGSRMFGPNNDILYYFESVNPSYILPVLVNWTQKPAPIPEPYMPVDYRPFKLLAPFENEAVTSIDDGSHVYSAPDGIGQYLPDSGNINQIKIYDGNSVASQFFGTIDSNWFNIANWKDDGNNPSISLPSTSINVQVFAPIKTTSNGVGNARNINFNQNTFLKNSTIVVQESAIFNSNSYNLGSISGNAYFLDNSYNQGYYPTLFNLNTMPEIDYLIVAGGGGGSAGKRLGAGAGGGAGGLLQGSYNIISPNVTNSYNIVVGNGGLGGISGGTTNTQGQNSIVFGLTAIGGGWGAGINSVTGGNGGSGGGGLGTLASEVGLGTPGQGNNGGIGGGSVSCAGGGGAGSTGFGNNGGNGLVSFITGVSAYYAGGGGGGNATTGGTGGFGGGGNGGGEVHSYGTNGTSGINGFGGGGGGGGTSGPTGGPYSNGGNGGNGVVILSYKYPTQIATGGTVTNYIDSNGQKNWVHTFTSNGTFAITTPNIDSSSYGRIFTNIGNPYVSSYPFTSNTLVTSGLVFHLDAEGYTGNGSTWVDTISGIVGTAQNSPTYVATSPSYFYLNGNSQAFNFTRWNSAINLNNNFSLEAWVNVLGNNEWGGIISLATGGYEDFGNGQGEQYSLDTTYYGQFRFDVNTGSYLNGAHYSLNNWTHVVVTYQNGTSNTYIDGLLTDTQNIASYVNTIQDAYLSIGCNQYGGFEYLNGQVGLISIYNKVLAPLEVLQNYNAKKNRFGKGPFGSFLYFDGNSKIQPLSGGTDFSFGIDDFTIEGWICPTRNNGTSQCFYDTRYQGWWDGYYHPLLYLRSGLYLTYHDGYGDVIDGDYIPLNTWNHIAVSRKDNQTRLFLNGIQTGGTASDTRNYISEIDHPLIGGSFDNYNFQGFIEYFKVTKGIGKYTTNFIPPTSVPTNDPYITGMVSNTAFFNDTSFNLGTLTNAVFSGNSQNFGSVINADFYYPAYDAEIGTHSTVNYYNYFPLSTDLIGYWKFEETSGDRGDYTGIGNTITEVNGTVGYGSGIIGNAANITDGNNTSWLAIPEGICDFDYGQKTYSIWFKLNQTNIGYQWILCQGTGNDQTDLNPFYIEGNSELACIFYDSSYYSWYPLYSNIVPTANVWHNAVVTFDGSNVNLYYDGKLVASRGYTAPMSNSGSSYTLGHYNASPYNGIFSGYLDEFGIWNRALSQGEVSFLYNLGKGNTYPFGVPFN